MKHKAYDDGDGTRAFPPAYAVLAVRHWGWQARASARRDVEDNTVEGRAAALRFTIRHDASR